MVDVIHNMQDNNNLIITIDLSSSQTKFEDFYLNIYNYLSCMWSKVFCRIDFVIGYE